MKTTTRLAVPFFYALLMSACNSSDNYPAGFIGFERRFGEHTYDTNHEEETITLKIVATEKQDKDLKLKINSSSDPSFIKLKENNPILPKGKKTLKIDVLLFPKKIKQGQRILHFSCKPEGQDAKISEISIQLRKK